MQILFQGRRALAVAILLLLAFGPQGLSAQQRDLVTNLFEQAKSLFAQGRHRMSIVRLQQAEKLGPKPTLLARIKLYIGLNNVSLQRTSTARTAFREALHIDPSLTISIKSFSEAHCSNFNGVRDSLQGKISVIADQAGAVVLVDGKLMGKVPLLKAVKVGAHHVEVRAANGRARFTKRVKVLPDAEVRISASLSDPMGRITVQANEEAVQVLLDGEMIGITPLPATPVVAGRHRITMRKAGFREQAQEVTIQPDREMALQVTLEPAPADQIDELQARQPIVRGSRLWTWVAAGGTAITGLAAIGMGVSVKVQADEYEDTPVTDLARLKELESSMEDHALVTNILLGVTGALALTTVVLFFVEDRMVTSPGAEDSARGTFPRRTVLAPILGETNGLMLQTHF